MVGEISSDSEILVLLAPNNHFVESYTPEFKNIVTCPFIKAKSKEISALKLFYDKHLYFRVVWIVEQEITVCLIVH